MSTETAPVPPSATFVCVNNFIRLSPQSNDVISGGLQSSFQLDITDPDEILDGSQAATKARGTTWLNYVIAAYGWSFRAVDSGPFKGTPIICETADVKDQMAVGSWDKQTLVLCDHNTNGSPISPAPVVFKLALNRENADGTLEPFEWDPQVENNGSGN